MRPTAKSLVDKEKDERCNSRKDVNLGYIFRVTLLLGEGKGGKTR